MSQLEKWLSRPPSMSEDLTPREAEVLQLLAQGLADEAIAGQLQLSKATTRFHLQNIYAKLGVKGAREAIAWVYQNGWLK